MKKILTTTFLFLFIMIATIGVNAQEVEMRSIDEIMIEIRTDLGITDTEVIDLSLVKVELIEELGDSVMEAYIGNSIMHEQMDEYYGGDDSETLSNLHIQIGQDYLNGYPITMRSFMLYDNQDSTYANRSYGGMMGRYYDSYYDNQDSTYPNRSYGGMMGRYYDSYYDNQTNSGFGMMGRNYYSSIGDREYGASVYNRYGMMNNLGWGGMVMGMIGFILLIIVLVYLFSPNLRNQGLPLSNNALNIAKERYARGEITRDEFLQITSTLR